MMIKYTIHVALTIHTILIWPSLGFVNKNTLNAINFPGGVGWGGGGGGVGGGSCLKIWIWLQHLHNELYDYTQNIYEIQNDTDVIIQKTSMK